MSIVRFNALLIASMVENLISAGFSDSISYIVGGVTPALSANCLTLHFLFSL
nr:MAG TPA: hypothetical protein [Bacteriophage sp.]